MNDKEKLKAIMKLLRREMKDVEKAEAEDREYTSLKGNGCNCCEANAVLRPIVEQCEAIFKGEAPTET